MELIHIQFIYLDKWRIFPLLLDLYIKGYLRESNFYSKDCIKAIILEFDFSLN